MIAVASCSGSATVFMLLEKDKALAFPAGFGHEGACPRPILADDKLRKVEGSINLAESFFF